jgi:hypothetical protein
VGEKISKKQEKERSLGKTKKQNKTRKREVTLYAP